MLSSNSLQQVIYTHGRGAQASLAFHPYEVGKWVALISW